MVKIARTLAVCVLTAGVLIFGAVKFRGAKFRSALWRVVQLCVVDHEITGAAFPCLLVNVAEGIERGYVIIRAPFGNKEVILAPTRKVVGVEEPWLQSPYSPNYFENAWHERFLIEPQDRKLADREFALAVNSALIRSQDQLHIHLGCLVPIASRKLNAFAPQLRTGEWSRFPVVIYNAEFWGFPLSEAGLAVVNPFRLAAEGPAGRDGDLSRLMLIVIRLRIPADEQWVLLASNLGGTGIYTQLDADDILDPSCRKEF